ncbi:MAG TPA: glycosyltransferase [Cyclobacteriaceae bacterium]|nr:glycosyltransferase [Cyclobacteriaceae bacterium]
MRRVLVTPLDWGLGHASRCVPIVRALLDLNCEVSIGGCGYSLELLKEEFPSLKFFELPGYDPVYSASSSLIWKMTQQLYKFIRTIDKEQKEIEELVRSENIDLIISDNRYGCWSHSIKSIFITHQLTILLPKRIEWISGIVNHFNHRQIRNFHECWVPDWEKEGLAGRLSRTKVHRVKYIGPLSRFEKKEQQIKKTFDILIMLSGPEPQRTILEEIMTREFQRVEKDICIVRGVPGRSVRKAGKNISVIDFLNARDLQLLIQQSDLLICRSGYSTIMDLSIIGGKVLFIPTPGQSEQEYLAQRLKDKGVAFSISQDEFDWETVEGEIEKYPGFQSMGYNGHLQEVLKDALVK